MTHSFFCPGIIEGFFGRPWSWQARQDYAQFCQTYHYQFYIYAPKADPYLRQNWPGFWPSDMFVQLQQLGETYRQSGVQWGIGINLFEMHFDFDGAVAQQLEQKIRYLNQLQPDILAILFDDMRGDCDRLASVQADITHRIMDWSSASLFLMCPTYYSSSPVLDQLFGDRPTHYLEQLGQLLHPEVQVFWTGPDICSSHYPADHLEAIAQQLNRKPFLWDNYPVNDSAKLCQFLHLNPFEQRPVSMQALIAGHAVNPMNQAYLSQIPLLTLYQTSGSPQEKLHSALQTLCPPPLAHAIAGDLPLFQQGLQHLTPAQKSQLIEKYSSFQLPQSLEIVEWLEGKFPHSLECLTL